MSDEINPRIKDRITKIEQNLKTIAKGLKKIHELVEDESGEEIFEPGEEIQGIKLTS